MIGLSNTSFFRFGGNITINPDDNKRSGGDMMAASTPQEQEYGLIFWNCTITGDPGVKDVWLGRPWREYAHIVFVHSEMEELIHPEGWNNWGSEVKEKTARYVEIGNTGPGAATEGRVAWSKQLPESESVLYTKEKVLAGEDGWNP